MKKQHLFLIIACLVSLPTISSETPCESRWQKFALSVGTGIATGVASGALTFYNSKNFEQDFAALASKNGLSDAEKKKVVNWLVCEGLAYESFNWATFWMGRRFVVEHYEPGYQWLSFSVSMLTYLLTQMALRKKFLASSFVIR
jgi:hypothetical protein